MTVLNKPFVVESVIMDDIRNSIRSRALPWDGYARTGDLSTEDSKLLKSLVDAKDRELVILNNKELYSTKFISILSQPNQKEDIIKFVLVIILDALILEPKFAKDLIHTKEIDSSLPFAPLAGFLNSDDETIRLSASYALTLLLLQADVSEYESFKEYLLVQFDFLSSKLLTSTNVTTISFATQQLKELLTFKPYRLVFWQHHLKNFPPLIKLFKENRGDLQLKYYITLSIWLLTFNREVSADISKNYPELIKYFFEVSKDAVKEKIVRLSISSLLNILVNCDQSESVIKQFLLYKGLEITKQLIERKWADEELKTDLDTLLGILNDAISTLTTFDEYETELKTQHLSWSPSHSSEEFWIENIDKFKENNYKLIRDLNTILSLDLTDIDQLYLNQTIICHDLSQLIKIQPDFVKVIDSIGLKTKVMALMNSPNANVKYEALKTTQKLVAHSL